MGFPVIFFIPGKNVMVELGNGVNGFYTYTIPEGVVVNGSILCRMEAAL
jgi:hypothetical protein